MFFWWGESQAIVSSIKWNKIARKLSLIYEKSEYELKAFDKCRKLRYSTPKFNSIPAKQRNRTKEWFKKFK